MAVIGSSGRGSNDLMQENERILLVDADTTLCTQLSRLLEGRGHLVVVADSAVAGMALFRNDPFPLVFTDICLQGMHGLQFIQEIKKQRDDTEVVVISSNASLDSAIGALRGGAYDYIVKPITDEELIASLVERALEKTRLVRHNQAMLDQLRRNNETLERSNSILKDLALHDGLTGGLGGRVARVVGRAAGGVTGVARGAANRGAGAAGVDRAAERAGAHHAAAGSAEHAANPATTT